MNQMSLDGTWALRWTDGQRGQANLKQDEWVDDRLNLEAQVPGEVHLDLWRQGLIADPYAGTNCLSARWVEECIWSYRREFDVPAEALAGRCWLVFEALDLAATVLLNGQEIGRHDNVFYPCRLEVTGRLKAGRNVLTVHLDSGLFYVAEKPWTGLNSYLDGRLHKRHWLRKPQCQFSWDWATRLVNVGITGPVRLEWTDAVARVDRLVPWVTLSEDLQHGAVTARLFVEGLSDRPIDAVLTVELPEAGVRQSATVQVLPGLHPVQLRIDVPKPKPWWPAGQGPADRYLLRTSLTVGGKVLAERSCKIGFRHVRVVQEPLEVGRSFVFHINGRPIFCKGANFVPADMIFARLDRERYRQLVDRALEANFNFLRVWGGGLYESNDFYDLCDEHGILVWQEFIFACSRYPATDEAFAASVRAEAIHNIRRLARHPSLIAWCGNNEIEQGYWDWGYDNRGVVLPDHGLYHLVLPRLLAQEDPTRYYQPSSPYSPDGLRPTLDEIGDQHPWSVGFANGDFRDYRKMICRFPNEGGILGPTSLPTMLECLPEGQRFVQSFAWQVHDNGINTWGEPGYANQMIRQWLGRDGAEMSVEEFTYRAGLLQGEGLREYIDNFRRRKFHSAAAIFWMFNDCWPATRSWTIVDYRLRRTPAFWAVKRAMRPVHVVVAEEQDRIVIYGINDTPEAVEAELRYGVFELAGGRPIERRTGVTLDANASTPLAAFDRAEWTHPERSMAFAALETGSRVLARNRLFLPLLKDLAWPRPQVRVDMRDGQAVFTSDTFAWGVCLDLDGEQPLADNLFDLWPNEPYIIPWRAPGPPQVLWTGNLHHT